MTVLRQTIKGLSIALLAVALLWFTWLTGQAENQFARADSQISDCIIPSDWAVYSLQADDDLAHLAEAADYTVEEILAANCLPVDANLPVDEDIYLPPDVLTLMGSDCGPPQGWGYYTTEMGDSLASLAEEFSVSIEQVIQANCFEDEGDFEPGLRIYAPPAALSTPTRTSRPSQSPTIPDEGSPAPSPTQGP